MSETEVAELARFLGGEFATGSGVAPSLHLLAIRDADRVGETDEWSVSAEGVAGIGVGRSCDEAAGVLMRVNPAAFGVASLIALDPEADQFIL